jgi:hypothetical protein
MVVRYPRLEQFFGGYLHQDWPEMFGDWTGAVDSYRNDTSAREREEVAADIEELVRTAASDEALSSQLFQEFGCCYDPRPDLGGPSIRAWLGAVVARLRQPDR